jgi:hypothetical protein
VRNGRPSYASGLSSTNELIRALRCPTSPRLSGIRRTVQSTSLPQRGHLLPKLADLGEAIRSQVTTRPDATLAELQAWLSKTHQVSVSSGPMWRC